MFSISKDFVTLSYANLLMNLLV